MVFGKMPFITRISGDMVGQSQLLSLKYISYDLIRQNFTSYLY